MTPQSGIREVITPDPNLAEEIRLLELQVLALSHVRDRNYKSLARLLDFQPQFTAEKGQHIVKAMHHASYLDDQDFTYGHQLTGYQLKVLAYVKKASASIGKGDITIHFDYVARVEREGFVYVAEFPDLPGCVTQDKTLAATKDSAREALIGYVSSKMLHGDTLPAPKYHGRKTKNVRPLRVILGLHDLVFIDDQTAKEEQARADFAYRTELAQIRAR